MSEGDVVNPRLREPTWSRPTGAKRWADYLDWLREGFIVAVTSLGEQKQRRSLLPSGWTPIELLSHVLHMEQRWFVWGFLGEPVEQPWGDWNTPEPWIDDHSDEVKAGARWVVPPEVDAMDIAERLRTMGGRTRAVLEDHRMDAVAAAGGRFGDDPPTLEWICFHVLAEYARHAGQLDVALEVTETGDDLEF